MEKLARCKSAYNATLWGVWKNGRGAKTPGTVQKRTSIPPIWESEKMARCKTTQGYHQIGNLEKLGRCKERLRIQLNCKSPSIQRKRESGKTGAAQNAPAYHQLEIWKTRRSAKTTQYNTNYGIWKIGTVPPSKPPTRESGKLAFGIGSTWIRDEFDISA